MTSVIVIYIIAKKQSSKSNTLKNKKIYLSHKSAHKPWSYRCTRAFTQV